MQIQIIPQSALQITLGAVVFMLRDLLRIVQYNGTRCNLMELTWRNYRNFLSSMVRYICVDTYTNKLYYSN